MGFDNLLRININGINIAYRKAGTGNPVILVHGYNESSEFFWDNLVNQFQDRYTFWGIDLPGFGNSEKPRSRFLIEDQSKIVESFIAELHIANPVIVAHSFGGLVAARLNKLNETQNIKGIILYDTPITKGFVRNFSLMKNAPMLILMIGILSIPLAGRLLFSFRNPKITRLGLARSGLICNPMRYLTDQYVKIVNQSSYDAFIKTIWATGLHSNLLFDVSNTNTPIHYIYGACDPFIAPSDINILVGKTSVREIYKIEDTCHVALIESPLVFNSIIEKLFTVMANEN